MGADPPVVAVNVDEVDGLASERIDARLGRLARVLDSSMRVPGTRFRFGLDAVIGLIPGVGDAAGTLLSSYIVLEAARAGAPKHVLVRMATHVVVESVVGVVPILGDLFDVAWKANERNVRLLREWRHRTPGGARTTRSALWVVAGILAFGILSSILSGVLVVSVLVAAIVG